MTVTAGLQETAVRMSDREERMARNETTARQINEDIEDAQPSSGPGLLTIVCECGDRDCSRVIAISVPEYESVRAESHALRRGERPRGARHRGRHRGDRPIHRRPQAPGCAGIDRRGGGSALLAGRGARPVQLEPVSRLVRAPSAREPVDDEQSPARLGPRGGTDRPGHRGGSGGTRAVAHGHAQACARPVGADPGSRRRRAGRRA